MRKPIIAGNWKMNKTPKEARELVEALKPLVKDAKATVVVCVPAVDIAAAAEHQGIHPQQHIIQIGHALAGRHNHRHAASQAHTLVVCLGQLTAVFTKVGSNANDGPYARRFVGTRHVIIFLFPGLHSDSNL